MKKIIIFILIIGLIIGGYMYIVKKEDQKIRCDDGFRFNPATGSCESANLNQKNSFDITSLEIKTASGNKISLVQDADTTRYTGELKDSQDATGGEYISLDMREAIEFQDNFIIIPYLYNSGGTGQFIYLGLFDKNSNTHLEGIVLGDRIKIDSIQTAGDKIKVNFKNRLITQSFAETPTIPTQFVFEIKENKIIPIVQLQNADYSDIELKSPESGTYVENILVIKGAIPGTWYFEANAHFKILNNLYQEIAIGNIQALSDWMTTQKVPFELSVPVNSLNYTGDAIVVIESENVQGDEEGEKNIKRMYIPIRIK